MNEFQKTTFLPLLLISFLIIHSSSAANDTIGTSQGIRDGETLVSSGGMFELGFFSPGNSSNRYVGIWYRNITNRTYVWVANRQVPVTSNSGVLRVTETGVLALINGPNGTIVWSSNATRSVGNPSARLLDTGNLVVKAANDDRPENFLWQSFDHPADTYLPGMLSLGWDLVTGEETYLSSWRSEDDPSPGEFTAHLDPNGYPQMLIKRRNVTQNRVGPWNGARFSGATASTRIDQLLVMNRNEIRYGDGFAEGTVVTRVTLTVDGAILRRTWNFRTNWTTFWNMPADNCDTYNWCGAYGFCDIVNSPPCGCLDRFVPRDQESWAAADWSSGCVRRTAFNCQDDVFLRYSGLKLPDSHNSTFNDRATSPADCEGECSRNCSCVGYARLNITGEGSGCLFYHGELIDIRTLPTGGQDLYIRMSSAERENVEGSGENKRVGLIASLTSVAGIVFLCVIAFFIYNRTRKKHSRLGNEVAVAGPFSGNRIVNDADLPFYDLFTILQATGHFSSKNKLGEGGFGPVYRGTLEDGQEIAVKRMSKTSSQGVNELKNEVILIAKLQHRNLVRTLGFCVEGEEKMLIYEYMPNHSLDLILFDQTRSMLLNWQKRFDIINGIAKGLLYLHQDSRLRIIHRDLKASNILLDADMNPKISDFGLARSFGGNETEAQTLRVVGTYGYMSPEYAMDGLFSIKSDVFSFGVLVLEIVSGKRNRGFSLQDHNLNLVGHAWALYKEGNTCKLVDPSLGASFDMSQVLRSIHVGLLCVQNSPEDRPSMSSVVFMLGNEVELPQAKQPGIFREKDVLFGQSSNSTNAANSGNQITITMPEGR